MVILATGTFSFLLIFVSICLTTTNGAFSEHFAVTKSTHQLNKMTHLRFYFHDMGMYALASKSDTGLLMVMNFVFFEGRFNGSAISLRGRDRIADRVREMPIIGGSGIFQFARGYALARTVRKTGDAVVEYDVFVMHE
ncbi:hypothetical protein NMG60_11029538 [Bertholletia excelsa]